MKRACFLLFCLIAITHQAASQLTLSHNIGSELSAKSYCFSCTNMDMYWGRTFVLEDFGIMPGEDFIINSADIGIMGVFDWGPIIEVNIYKADANFPGSFSRADLIGSSQQEFVADNLLHILTVKFDTPVTVPANVEKILVEVHQIFGHGTVILAGTAQDDDLSYVVYCSETVYDTTVNKGFPDARSYIVINGKPSGLYNISFSSNCTDYTKNFAVSNTSKIAAVSWDFGDSSSVSNTSVAINPSHEFSGPGNFTVTARITDAGGDIFTAKKVVAVTVPPVAHALNDIFVCEDISGQGISSLINTAGIEAAVLNGQADKVVTYYNSYGALLPAPLPNPYTNTKAGSETIKVRVSAKDDPGCYAETTFDIKVAALPVAHAVKDLSVCDDDNDGFAVFDLSSNEAALLGNQAGMAVSFYDGGKLLSSPFTSTTANRQIITAHVTNRATGCTAQTTFTVIAAPLPVAHAVAAITGCDDNGDGISEYFDTAALQSTVLGGQTGMEIAYFDSNGNKIKDIGNPYTNATPYMETITVRVTNTKTQCFAETNVIFKTTTQPAINTVADLFACDEGNGLAHFDTSGVESQLIGTQTGLVVHYTDDNGKPLPSPLPQSFLNTAANVETIHVRVENAVNALCFSETQFKLIVSPLPVIDLQEHYSICALDASLPLSADPAFTSWQWTYQDGTVVSGTYKANLVNPGNYTLTVSKANNGIVCYNSFPFSMSRSQLPVIKEVIYKDLSDANYIEVIAAGDGVPEYSIDGIHYQDSAIFTGLSGGIYTVHVRDKAGCGHDFKEVVLLDYPKFFTPDNDAVHDYWQITGIRKFPVAIVYIFDRFGKLLAQIKPKDRGWDGTCNGRLLPATDYWFTADLKNGRTFNGHFSLVR